MRADEREASGKCPENVREMSGRRPLNVPQMSACGAEKDVV